MYNPINMVVEDEQRLVEKDMRDKNKKKRYEVRTQVEASTREEGLAEQDRLDLMSLRKISHKHTEEIVARNYNILTNGELPTSIKIIQKDEQEFLKRPPQLWDHIQQPALSQKAESHASSRPDVELSHTQFGTRAARVNLNAPKSTQSAAPSSKRSLIRSGGFQKLGVELSK